MNSTIKTVQKVLNLITSPESLAMCNFGNLGFTTLSRHFSDERGLPISCSFLSPGSAVVDVSLTDVFVT